MPLIAIALLLLFQEIMAQQQPDFNYLHRGDDWPGLCSYGHQQSPVNLHGAIGNCDDKLQIEVFFEDSDLNITIQKFHEHLQSIGRFSHMRATTYKGQVVEFEATQFHFHQPSEHLLDGEACDVEMHIFYVLKPEYRANPPDKPWAVVAILFNRSNEANNNHFFDMWNPSMINTTFTFNMQKAMDGIFNHNKPFYVYEGSRTVPPCEELINFYVYPDPENIQQEQLDIIKSYFQNNKEFANGNGNNRRVQKLYGRRIKEGNIPCEDYFGEFVGFASVLISVSVVVICIRRPRLKTQAM